MSPKTLNAIGAFLQLAAIADIEYEQAKTNGKSTLLSPGNFQAALAAIGGVIEELYPPAQAVPAPDASATTKGA